MTELKWVDGVLYYRSLVPAWLSGGAWGEPSQWTDWKQVPTEYAKDATSKKGTSVNRARRSAP